MSPGSTTSTTPGTQIDRFVDSLIAAAKGEPTPEDGYVGAYIADIAGRRAEGGAGRARAAPTTNGGKRSGGSAST